MEPQGEQAQSDLRHWDGDPSGGPDEEMGEPDFSSPYNERSTRPGGGLRVSRWSRLLGVYDEIEEDYFWGYLRLPGIKLVKGDGAHSTDAKIMIVGEAPGAHENGAGRPFVGQSGRIIDQAIDVMAQQKGYRSRCFLTNVLKYRPPGNATPNLAAILHGQESLRKEWAIVRPTLTIAVGATAHSAIHPLRGVMSMSQARVQPGTPHLYRRTTSDAPYRYCISIFHPAYAMWTRDKAKRERIMEQIESDWTLLGDWLRENLPDVLE